MATLLQDPEAMQYFIKMLARRFKQNPPSRQSLIETAFALGTAGARKWLEEEAIMGEPTREFFIEALNNYSNDRYKKIARSLVARKPDLVNSLDGKKATPLVYALEQEHLDAANFLLDFNAFLDSDARRVAHEKFKIYARSGIKEEQEKAKKYDAILNRRSMQYSFYPEYKE